VTSDAVLPSAPADPARVALLDAASAILAEDGPDRLTVRRIAARAGCSTMLVYSRLGGKQGVVEALWIEGFQRLAAVLQSEPPTADPLADLRRGGGQYRAFALENPTYYAVMFDRAVPDFRPSAEAGRIASATLDVLGAGVQRAIDAGAFGPGDARQIAACLWAANHGAVSLELKHSGPRDIDWPRCHERVIDAVIEGFANRA
jgi:AcrR family transcriptional regulator